MIKKLFFIHDPNKEKERVYTTLEVSRIHNRYRFFILILTTIFLLIAQHYGFLDDIVSSMFGWTKEVNKKTLWSQTLTFVSWGATVFTFITGVLQVWEFLKKNKKLTNKDGESV